MHLTATLDKLWYWKNSKSAEGKWFTSIQYGTGKGFPIQKIDDNYYKNIEKLILSFRGGSEFLSYINNGFSKKIGNAQELQKLYELQKSTPNLTEPTELVDTIQELIEKLNIERKDINQKELRVFKYKEKIPVRQFFALYAINKISTIANEKLVCQ